MNSYWIAREIRAIVMVKGFKQRMRMTVSEAPTFLLSSRQAGGKTTAHVGEQIIQVTDIHLMDSEVCFTSVPLTPSPRAPVWAKRMT